MSCPQIGHGSESVLFEPAIIDLATDAAIGFQDGSNMLF